MSGVAQPRLEKHFTHKQYTTYEGLAQSQINRIVQDSKGYLWICTKGGLSRFDGQNFRNFVDTQDGERLNTQNIIETREGFIVNTITKIFRFTYQEENPDKWGFEDIEIPGDFRFTIQTFYFLSEADKCLYLFNAKNYNFKDERVIHFKYDLNLKAITPLPLSEKPIILSYADKSTRYFIDPDNSYSFRKGVFQCQKLPDHFDNYALNPADSTLYAWQKSTRTIFRIQKDLKSSTPVFKNISVNLKSCAEPNTFIITRSGKFIFFNEKRQLCFIHLAQPKVINLATNLRYLYSGRENNLWVGTEEGLFNLFQLGFEQYVFNITQSTDNVWSLACAPDSTMWFGGFTTGVWSLNRKEQLNVYTCDDFKLNLKDTSLFRYIYMGGTRDIEGRIYLPSATGMLIVDKEQLTYRDTHNVPMSIYDDAENNRLIVGKVIGLELIEKGTGKTIIDIPSYQNIISICVNREGKVMAGSFRKQFILEGDSLKPYPSAKNLGVISMVKDSKCNIWKGTPVGLFLDDGMRETEILPALIRGSISAVFIKKPWLLATTVKNMYLLNLDQFYQTGVPFAYQFGAENGYIAMDGGQNGFCADNEGKVWYTVTDKVLRFSPDSLVRHFNSYLPAPHFASVSFSRNAVEWQRSVPRDTSELIRDHVFNSLRFTMSAVSETQTDKVVYQYRLRGMSDEWSQPTKVAQQTFTNLHPGNYTMEIRSSLDGDHWSEIVTSPSITIKSAWWEKWWAIFIEIILTGGLIAYLAIYFAKKRQKKMIRKLTEQKRLNELRLQSVRSKNIPHFSGNALASIESFIFSADLRQANKFLTKYSRLMNITLRDADRASRSIEQELEYVRLYLELEKMRFGEKLEYYIVIAETVNQKIELPNMLMQTWVENGIKHGIRHKQGVGKILIKISKSDSNQISVSVEDNGIGRTKAGELGTAGTGQGLRIIAEQIAIYNLINESKIVLKTIDLTDNDGSAQGTRFEIIIPAIYNYNF
jgi:hypothetical protein